MLTNPAWTQGGYRTLTAAVVPAGDIPAARDSTHSPHPVHDSYTIEGYPVNIESQLAARPA